MTGTGLQCTLQNQSALQSPTLVLAAQQPGDTGFLSFLGSTGQLSGCQGVSPGSGHRARLQAGGKQERLGPSGLSVTSVPGGQAETGSALHPFSGGWDERGRERAGESLGGVGSGLCLALRWSV